MPLVQSHVRPWSRFLFGLAPALISIVHFSGCGVADPSADAVYRTLAAETKGVAVVEGKRVPLGWPVFALEPGRAVRLTLPPSARPLGAKARFRLTTGVDDRIERTIVVATGSGRSLGTLDLRYAHAIEIFELALTAPDADAVAREGIELTLTGEGPPLWFFDQAASDSRLPVEYQPHLMMAATGVDPQEAFHRRFASLASLQTFGWMEGCILDGLRDLARRFTDDPRYEAARRAHWEIFRGADGELIYETPRSGPVANAVYGIEGGLPFADLALAEPNHPWVDLFLAFAQREMRPDGLIQDHGTTSAEGSYTIAFPLAAIAKARGDADLGALAVRQLLLRRDRLWHEGEVWLRSHDDGSWTFRGWARGVAWHFLGLVRSLEVLRDVPGCDVSEIEAEIRRVAAWVGPLQRADGLWPVYVGDPAAHIDTSGTAGIAAALAMGVNLGVLPEGDLERARRARQAVMGFLTPDGFLGGVAQSNRGGEALQRSDYRVLSQMAMGLLAQLIAATE